MRPSSIRRTWLNHRSLRCLSRVYILGRPTRDRTSALVTLSSQDMPSIRRMLLRWNVLSLSLLPGICRPRLAAIQQCADNTGIVDRHLCLLRQLGACPHSSCEMGESWSCLPNPLVDLCVQWEVVSDGRAEVGELADSIGFAIATSNDRRCLCVLSQDIRLLQTDGQSEVLTGLWEAVHQWLELILGVSRNCCVISKQHVPDEILAYLCLGSETGEVEEPVIWAGTKVDSFCCCV